MFRYILLIVVCLASISPTYASGKVQCTLEDAYKAETTIDNLKTWDDLYRHFKRYAACHFDDAAIAEGYSDMVGRLLSKDWKDVIKLKKLCISDKAFEKFISKHLDETIPADTWNTMMVNATKKCPSEAKGICTVIKKANDAIEQQINQDRQRKS
jgi:hypothetical protein